MKRLTGKQFVPAFVALMGILSAIALWQRSESESAGLGKVLAERTLSDGTSLRLSQVEDDDTFEGYLALHEKDGSQRWRKGIYVVTDPKLESLTLGQNIITVRAADTRGNHETLAFSRDDGTFLWRGGRVKEAAPVARPSERREDRVVEYYGPPVNEELVLSIVSGDLLERKKSEN